MLRIAVMLDSFVVDAWIAKIVDDINASDFAHISLVVLNTPVIRRPLPLGKRIKAHWMRTAHVVYDRWDYRRNRSANDAMAAVDLSEKLRDVPAIQIDPLRKGFTDRFGDEDVAAIRAADLDVIFRFGFRIIRGEILNAAHYGVWSFHHDDNLKYRGGPPLFWEIYEKNPISGTVLQRLTDALDGGHVLYRSHSRTNLSSLYLNRNPIYWKTAEFAIRRLSDLHERGYEYLESLPTYHEPNSYSRGIYRTPHTAQMGVFVARKCSRSLRGRLRAAVSGNRPQWFFAVRRRSLQHRFDNTAGYRIVHPPKDRFYADPFLYKYQGKTFLFFEDYRYAEERALISCTELDAAGNLGKIVEVLRRPYHLSYPFVFEYEGQIYMIPETVENRTIELYRAVDFPHEWKLDSILLEDIHAVDATVHQINGKLWMFTAVSNGRYSDCDELAIFHSEKLTGPWKPHRGNPVISDVRRARPAGALFYDEGRLIRPSQDCSRAYGYGLNFSEVVVLNEEDYQERPVGRIEPSWAKKNLGTHTYTRSDDFELIDGNITIKPQH